MADEKTSTAPAKTAPATTNATAVTGAQAVADAVKKVADAAVVAVQSAPAGGPQGEFTVTGTKGGKIRVQGDGFGASGTLTLNGVQVNTREWGAAYIEGDLSADAKSGEVVVHVDDKTSKRAQLTL